MILIHVPLWHWWMSCCLALNDVLWENLCEVIKQKLCKYVLWMYRVFQKWMHVLGSKLYLLPVLEWQTFAPLFKRDLNTLPLFRFWLWCDFVSPCVAGLECLQFHFLYILEDNADFLICSESLFPADLLLLWQCWRWYFVKWEVYIYLFLVANGRPWLDTNERCLKMLIFFLRSILKVL